MLERESPKIEYNLAGGLALTITQKDFLNLLEELPRAGYRYGCLLPFRALQRPKVFEKIDQLPITIVNFEEAWNPTDKKFLATAVLAGLIGYGKKFLGDTTQPPILQDAFFPAKQTCDKLFNQIVNHFPNSKFISHELRIGFPYERLLIEINPGITFSLSELKEKSEELGFGLVFDPRHLVLPDKVLSVPKEPVKPYRGGWERQFAEVFPRVEVVDINPPSKKDQADLERGCGLFKELAQAVKEVPSIKFLRVEIPIPLQYQIPWSPFNSKGLNYLREIHDKLESF